MEEDLREREGLEDVAESLNHGWTAGVFLRDCVDQLSSAGQQWGRNIETQTGSTVEIQNCRQGIFLIRQFPQSLSAFCSFGKHEGLDQAVRRESTGRR